MNKKWKPTKPVSVFAKKFNAQGLKILDKVTRIALDAEKSDAPHIPAQNKELMAFITHTMHARKASQDPSTLPSISDMLEVFVNTYTKAVLNNPLGYEAFDATKTKHTFPFLKKEAVGMSIHEISASLTSKGVKHVVVSGARISTQQKKAVKQAFFDATYNVFGNINDPKVTVNVLTAAGFDINVNLYNKAQQLVLDIDFKCKFDGKSITAVSVDGKHGDKKISGKFGDHTGYASLNNMVGLNDFSSVNTKKLVSYIAGLLQQVLDLYVR